MPPPVTPQAAIESAGKGAVAIVHLGVAVASGAREQELADDIEEIVVECMPCWGYILFCCLRRRLRSVSSRGSIGRASSDASCSQCGRSSPPSPMKPRF